MDAGWVDNPVALMLMVVTAFAVGFLSSFCTRSLGARQITACALPAAVALVEGSAACACASLPATASVPPASSQRFILAAADAPVQRAIAAASADDDNDDGDGDDDDGDDDERLHALPAAPPSHQPPPSRRSERGASSAPATAASSVSLATTTAAGSGQPHVAAAVVSGGAHREGLSIGAAQGGARTTHTMPADGRERGPTAPPVAARGANDPATGGAGTASASTTIDKVTCGSGSAGGGGGGGGGGFNVGAVAATSDIVDVALLDCVLQTEMAHHLVAMHANAPAAAALEARIRNMHTHARGMSAEESAGRLHELRVRGVLECSSTERQYSRLFAPLRAARVHILASLIDERHVPSDFSVRCRGSLLPVGTVADAVALSPATLASMMADCKSALHVAAPLGVALAAAYADDDFSADDIAERLRTLQRQGDDGDDEATASERSYAKLLQPIRALRQTIAVAIMRATLPEPSEGASPRVHAALLELTERVDDAAAVESACRELVGLAADERNQDALVAADAALWTVRTLRPHLLNAGVVCAAAELLRHCRFEKRHWEEGLPGVATLLMNACDIYSASPSVIGAAFGALAHMASWNTCTDDIRHAGVAEVVASALTTHAASAAVVKEACHLIEVLIQDVGDDCRLPFVEVGAIEAIIPALVTYAASEELIGAALQALAALLSFEADCASRASGSIPAIVGALVRHSACCRIADDACTLLRTLADTRFVGSACADNAAALIRAGGVPTMVAALKAHATAMFAVISIAAAVKVLAVSGGSAARTAIVAADGIPALVTALQAHVQVARKSYTPRSLPSMACETLLLLVLDPVDFVAGIDGFAVGALLPSALTAERASAIAAAGGTAVLEAACAVYADDIEAGTHHIRNLQEVLRRCGW